MRTKARKLERKTRAAELDMEIMRAREANGLPVISPMLGLAPEKWECEFRDYLVALGDPHGYDHYLDGHIPGAVFVDLETELAATPEPRLGRHPLPSIAALQACLRAC